MRRLSAALEAVLVRLEAWGVVCKFHEPLATWQALLLPDFFPADPPSNRAGRRQRRRPWW